MPRRSTETDVTAYPVSYIPAYTCSVSCENTASSSYTMDYALRVYTRARSRRSRVTYVRLTRVENATRGGACPGANRWTAPCFPARTSYTIVRDCIYVVTLRLSSLRFVYDRGFPNRSQARRCERLKLTRSSRTVRHFWNCKRDGRTSF